MISKPGDLGRGQDISKFHAFLFFPWGMIKPILEKDKYHEYCCFKHKSAYYVVINYSIAVVWEAKINRKFSFFLLIVDKGLLGHLDEYLQLHMPIKPRIWLSLVFGFITLEYSYQVYTLVYWNFHE